MKWTGLIIVSRCQLCGARTKGTNNHLFLHYSFTLRYGSFSLVSQIQSGPCLSILQICWAIGSKKEKARVKRYSGGLSLVPSSWLSGERNSRSFEIGPIQFRKWNCIVSFYFWYKEKGLDETKQLVAFLGSL